MLRRLMPLALLVALVVPFTGSKVSGAAPAGPGCPAGRVSVAMDAASLPGGRWSVTDGCLAPDAFYEVELAGHRLVLALTEANYDDGHRGRLAVAALTTPDGRAASLVGVEDHATGLVRWAYAEGRHAAGPGHTAVHGEGVTDAPEDPAAVEVQVHGRGADLMTAPGPVAEQVRHLVLGALEQLTAGGVPAGG